MSQIESAIEELYANNGSMLRRMCHKEMAKFGGISQKDYDDFYSRAGLEISLAKNRFDPSKETVFMEYISGVVRRAVQKEMTDRNRRKRRAIIETEERDEKGNVVKKKEYLSNLSIEAMLEQEGAGDADALWQKLPAGDTAQASEARDERIEKYLDSLSKIQRQIVEMKMERVPVQTIKETLNLSDKQYDCHFGELKSFAKLGILFGKGSGAGNSKEQRAPRPARAEGNCRTDRISIASLIQKIDRRVIRFDHPLQRESEQWTPSMKGNLVSDILQGNRMHPLVFAEQVIGGTRVIWDLDGKQRCANAYAYSKNGYKVSKHIRRWMIPVAVNAQFDIRGKKFSDLPQELQDRFLRYRFNYDQYLNCTEEDIGYHMERYNDGKPMTSLQKGIAKLGSEYIGQVKDISNMALFKDMGNYKVSEFKNGTVGRVIAESVIAAYAPERWGRLDAMCEYIRGYAGAFVFSDFRRMAERLERVMTDEAAALFDAKDTFLWFGLFARFIKTESDDRKFIEFLTALRRDGLTKKIRPAKEKEGVLKNLRELEARMQKHLCAGAGRSLDGSSQKGRRKSQDPAGDT